MTRNTGEFWGRTRKYRGKTGNKKRAQRKRNRCPGRMETRNVFFRVEKEKGTKNEKDTSKGRERWQRSRDDEKWKELSKKGGWGAEKARTIRLIDQSANKLGDAVGGTGNLRRSYKPRSKVPFVQHGKGASQGHGNRGKGAMNAVREEKG